MNELLKSILVLAIISGIINSLLMQGTIKKYVNYFIGLIMVLVLLSPLFKVLSSFDSIKEYINDFFHSIRTEEILEDSNALIVNTSEKRVCEGIKEMIVSKFGFDQRDVYVELECDKSDISSIKITGVNVILTNKASWSDTDRVKEFLDKSVGCKINVTRR
ncbi:MAG: stage III sporulation protein AF [Clostridia bacterium]|nr:stage III sporulation protein AF [Clostridia bacterium]